MRNEILLADDEMTFRETMATVLREESMHVTAVDNGTDAIACIRKKSYAVAILDIQMPGADGIKVLQEIMKVHPATRVIIITAYGAVERAVEAIKLGACDYVDKPVIFDDIIVKIRQHLRFAALEDKKGLFECARGGTLFLDEIGFMSVNCQVKLLRTVEQCQIMPVGSTEPIALDLRLMAATNRDLLKEIKEGRFREDLYYRMNVVGIHLAPLRDRTEDIPLLVEHFIGKYNQELGKQCQGVTEEALRLLMAHEWKGNIRELENVIERSIIFAEGDLIDTKNLGLVDRYVATSTGSDDNLQSSLEACEKQHISRVLHTFEGDKSEAARAMGVGLSSLYRKIDELEIKVSKNKQV